MFRRIKLLRTAGLRLIFGHLPAGIIAGDCTREKQLSSYYTPNDTSENAILQLTRRHSPGPLRFFTVPAHIPSLRLVERLDFPRCFLLFRQFRDTDMAAAGSNILRWSALFGGIAYGFYHQSSIKAADRAAAEKRHYQQQESLIAKARAEYVKKTSPAVTAGGDIIRDPNDPKFDLEAYLKVTEAETAGH